jgi:hypothetical protein
VSRWEELRGRTGADADALARRAQSSAAANSAADEVLDRRQADLMRSPARLYGAGSGSGGFGGDGTGDGSVLADPALYELRIKAGNDVNTAGGAGGSDAGAAASWASAFAGASAASAAGGAEGADADSAGFLNRPPSPETAAVLARVSELIAAPVGVTVRRGTRGAGAGAGPGMGTGVIDESDEEAAAADEDGESYGDGGVSGRGAGRGSDSVSKSIADMILAAHEGSSD